MARDFLCFCFAPLGLEGGGTFFPGVSPPAIVFCPFGTMPDAHSTSLRAGRTVAFAAQAGCLHSINHKFSKPCASGFAALCRDKCDSGYCGFTLMDFWGVRKWSHAAVTGFLRMAAAAVA